MIHEFTVPSGFGEKIVSISVDEESGKAAIRVDGKMAGRPLAPDETSREIRVGDDIYQLRREWDQFDLEFIGPANPMEPSLAKREPSSKAPTAKARGSFPIGKVLLAVMVAVVGGWIYRPLTNLLEDWNRFNAPNGSLSASMPGQVVEAKLGSFAKTAGARAWVAERGGKIFEIGYVDVNPDPRVEWRNAFINGVRDSIAKKYKGQVVNDKDWPGGTELLIHCLEWRDTSDGPKTERDVRIRLMVRGNRVNFAAASAPPHEIMSMTVTRFFLSVKAESNL